MRSLLCLLGIAAAIAPTCSYHAMGAFSATTLPLPDRAMEALENVNLSEDMSREHMHVLWENALLLGGLSPSDTAEDWQDLVDKAKEEKGWLPSWISSWIPFVGHDNCYTDVRNTVRGGCDMMSFEWFIDVIDKLRSCYKNPNKKTNGSGAREDFMLAMLYVFQLPKICHHEMQREIFEMMRVIQERQGGKMTDLQDELFQERQSRKQQAKRAEAAEQALSHLNETLEERVGNRTRSAELREKEAKKEKIQERQRAEECAQKHMESEKALSVAKIQAEERKSQADKCQSREDTHTSNIRRLEDSIDQERNNSASKWGCVSYLSSYNNGKTITCSLLIPFTQNWASPLKSICLLKGEDRIGVPNCVIDGVVVLSLMFAMVLLPWFIRSLTRTRAHNAHVRAEHFHLQSQTAPGPVTAKKRGANQTCNDNYSVMTLRPRKNTP